MQPSAENWDSQWSERKPLVRQDPRPSRATKMTYSTVFPLVIRKVAVPVLSSTTAGSTTRPDFATLAVPIPVNRRPVPKETVTFRVFGRPRTDSWMGTPMRAETRGAALTVDRAGRSRVVIETSSARQAVSTLMPPESICASAVVTPESHEASFCDIAIAVTSGV